MLTRKDFETIAEIISDSFGDDINLYAPSIFVERLAEYLATKNPRFDREQFLKACGLE